MKARAYVSGGHVYCRVTRTDMDIEKCFGCTHLRVLADEASPPFIVCETQGTEPSAEDDVAYAQWRRSHHRPERGYAV